MRNVFVNAGGQWENIGDSLLRRAYLDALRTAGTLHVYVGGHAAYASGLGTRPGDRVYTSRGRWLARTALAAALTRPIFAVNTGEMVGDQGEKRRTSWQRWIAELTGRTGGDVVTAGVSVRPGTDPALTHLPVFTARSAVMTWRDRASRDALGVGDVQPDWAFALGGDAAAVRESTGRDRLMVTMRGDQPEPDETWFDDVRALAGDLGVGIQVFVQVERDADRARVLAERLGADLLTWPAGTGHAAHEETLRAAYRSSVAVVSDRIHALIVGLTEGAVPLGFTTSGSTKVARTFGAVTAVPVGTTTDVADAARWREVLASRQTLADDLDAARSRLREVTGRIAALGSSRAGGGR